MKFSLKNKEFNKKRLNIFDRKSSNSPHFKSFSKQSLSKSKSPYDSSAKNNITISYNQDNSNFKQEHQLKHQSIVNDLSLSEIQEQNGQLINSNISNYQNNLLKSQNKNWTNKNQNANSFHLKTQSKERKNAIMPLPKPIQSVYHQQQKSIRQNKLMNSQLIDHSSSHPSKQIIFEPILRNSKSKSQSKQVQKKYIQKQAQNKQKIAKQYSYAIKNNVQSIIKDDQHINLKKQNYLLVQQIKKLKETIQQQNLKIKYLKNQKQIFQSNQLLKYNAKQQTYLKNQESAIKTSDNKNKLNETEDTKIKLTELYNILRQNQRKIKIWQQKQKNIHISVMVYIEKVQQKLLESVSIKYLQYKKSLEEKLCQFQKYIQKCSYLEDKLNLYSNTVRSVSESLRLTKLKQQNIELQIKQAKSIIQNKNFRKQSFANKNRQNQEQKNWRNLKKSQNSQLQIQNSPKNNLNFKSQLQNNFKKFTDCQSDISSIKRVQYDYDQFQQKQQNKQLYALSKDLQNKQKFSNNQESFSSFLDQKYSHLVYKRQNKEPNKQNFKQKKQMNKINNHFPNNYLSKTKEADQQSIRSEIYQIDDSNYDFNNSSTQNLELQKLSPFETNKMFKTKSKSFYEFQKCMNTIQDYRYQNESPNQNHINQNHINQNIKFKKIQDISFQSPNYAIKKDFISDTLQQQQMRIICLLEQKSYKFPIECWIDQMGCLRKKNNTYLFDSQGNMLVTTQSAYKKLCQKNILQSIQ